MKARTAGVLAALMLGGLLPCLDVAAPAPHYTTLRGALRKAGHALPERIGEPRVDEACLFVAEVLKPLAPPIDTASEETEEAILDAFLKATPGLRRNSPCTECEL